jgi:hypothetical protein
MNFSTSPPNALIGAASRSKWAFSRAMTASRGRLSDRAVEVPKVRAPEHRVDGLAVAAPDRAGQDPGAAAPAEIGLQQRRGGLAADHDLQGSGQESRGPMQEVRRGLIEALCSIRRQDEPVAGTIAEGDLELEMIGPVRRPCHPLAAELSGHAVEPRHLQRLRAIAPPLEGRAGDQGMQRRDRERRQAQRHIRRQEPRAQVRQQRRGARRRARFELQPFKQGFLRLPHRPSIAA